MAVRMANDEQSSTERRGRADWTGLIVAALMSPVFILFVYLGKAETGFTAYLVSCAVAVAIKLRWKLRKLAYAPQWLNGDRGRLASVDQLPGQRDQVH
jgi:hypothetical protein